MGYKVRVITKFDDTAKVLKNFAAEDRVAREYKVTLSAVPHALEIGFNIDIDEADGKGRLWLTADRADLAKYTIPDDFEEDTSHDIIFPKSDNFIARLEALESKIKSDKKTTVKNEAAPTEGVSTAQRRQTRKV